MNVKVLDIRLQNNNKPLKAFVDVRLDNGIVLKDFRVIQQPNRKAYIVAPQTSWKGPSGQVQYRTIVTLPNEVKWQFESAILAEYQRVEGEKDDNSQS